MTSWARVAASRACTAGEHHSLQRRRASASRAPPPRDESSRAASSANGNENCHMVALVVSTLSPEATPARSNGIAYIRFAPSTHSTTVCASKSDVTCAASSAATGAMADAVLGAVLGAISSGCARHGARRAAVAAMPRMTITCNARSGALMREAIKRQSRGTQEVIKNDDHLQCAERRADEGGNQEAIKRYSRGNQE